VTPRDPQAELEWGEFAGWMEAQGKDAMDDSAVYGSGDMIESFTGGMQAQRALDDDRDERLHLAAGRDEARSDYSRLRAAVLDDDQSDASVRRRCLEIIKTAGTPPVDAPLDAQRKHVPGNCQCTPCKTAPACPEAPVYRKVRQRLTGPQSSFWMIECNEGWRSLIFCTDLREADADWLLSLLGRKPSPAVLAGEP
jgi:hypothetical protein